MRRRGEGREGAGRTVLVGAHEDLWGGGPVSDGRAGEHPDAVRSPLVQPRDGVRELCGALERLVGRRAGRRVRADVLHLVVGDGAVVQLSGRRLPADSQRARVESDAADLLRRRPRNCEPCTRGGIEGGEGRGRGGALGLCDDTAGSGALGKKRKKRRRTVGCAASQGEEMR